MTVQKHILISGGTGFVGQNLVDVLLKQGHQVTVWGRNKEKIKFLFGDRVTAIDCLEDMVCSQDVVINLAGASIGEHRWTEKNKQLLLDSRLHATEMLYQWLQKQVRKPQCLINASAIGFYGIDTKERWAQVCDENSPSQNIFMSQLCARWEQKSNEFKKLDIQVVKLRLGVVLGQGGGILPRILKPIRYAKIGQIGSGRQPFVWVHMADVVGVILWLLSQKTWHDDVYNVVAPHITTQADFVAEASDVLNAYAPIRMSATMMRMILGEQSDLVLNGQKVAPKRLLEQGYVFQYPQLKQVLTSILK